jgi:GNAT superfamily N-acetyltransferase
VAAVVSLVARLLDSRLGHRPHLARVLKNWDRRMPSSPIATWTIRHGMLGDLDALAEIEIDATRALANAIDGNLDDITATPRYLLEASLAEALLLVACDKSERQIGFVAGATRDGYLYIGEVDVVQSWHRKGVGRALILRILDEIAPRNLKGAMLTTDRFVPFNMPFYSSIGFRELALSECPPSLRAVYDTEIVKPVDANRRVPMAFGF